MAFQNVRNNAPKATGDAVKLTQLNVGGAVTGFIVKLVPSLQNPETSNILMKQEDGDGTFYVYTAGNIKYLITDGLIKVGLLTKITRIDDKMVGGKKSSQFTVEQDPDSSLDEASFNDITPSSTVTAAEIKGTAAPNPTKQAVERASVKAQAQKLQAQASAAGGKR